MNKRTEKLLKTCVNHMFEYWIQLNDLYEIPIENRASIIIYGYSFYKKDEDDGINTIRECEWHGSAVMTTILQPGYQPVYENEEDNIVIDFKYTIYMSYEMLYEKLIDCELDLEKFFKVIDLTLRHELGHILSKRDRFINKTLREVYNADEEHDRIMRSLPKQRKNASEKNRLKNFLNFMEFPEEKMANERVGITKEELIENFYISK